MLRRTPSLTMSALVRCVQVAAYGGPEVLQVTNYPITDVQLKPTEVLIRNSFAGLNFIDTYFRSGLYQKEKLPYIAGDEGSGAIIKCGEGVDKARLGTRVAYFRSQGSYSSFVVANAADAFVIPDGLADDVAAAALLQGCTAHYLCTSCYVVGPGDTVLVHAAAGGTGLLLTQMCKLKGATVIGTCGGPEKAELAQRVGKVDHIIDYNATPDWAAAVRTIVRDGVHVVFDGVGKSTFEKGLGVLRRRGSMITFGNASGPVDPVAPLTLTKYGSITLQRPTLKDYSAPGEIEARVADVFGWLASKKLEVVIGKEFKLDDAAESHRYLMGRNSVGKVVINCQE